MGKGSRKVDRAREVAFLTLQAVAEADAYANIELAAQLKAAGLSEQDAGFATELVAGTLRWQGLYDGIIDQLAAHRLAPNVRVILRMGVHQVWSMRVPDHAAVDTSVRLCQQLVGHRPARLINAVLRKITARSKNHWRQTLSRQQLVSHPAWVIDELRRALGGAAAAELELLLETNNQPPPVTLVARPGLVAVDDLPGTADTVSPYGVTWPGGSVQQLPALQQGFAAVQDAGSQLVAVALARAAVPAEKGPWLDLCAGPGGKTALLAALRPPELPHLVAVELHRHRAQLVRQALRAFPATSTDVLQADGTTRVFSLQQFSRVLVDAPCTGLGAIRRRPESRWRRGPQDVAQLVELQQRLLRQAVEFVAPGGVVLYATCSPVLAETTEVIEHVIAHHQNVTLEPLGPLLPHLDNAECEHLPGAIQLWPHRHNTDAMFMALLRRS